MTSFRKPSRIFQSRPLMPAARTRMTATPGLASGREADESARASAPPNLVRVIARLFMSFLLRHGQLSVFHSCCADTKKKTEGLGNGTSGSGCTRGLRAGRDAWRDRQG